MVHAIREVKRGYRLKLEPTGWKILFVHHQIQEWYPLKGWASERNFKETVSYCNQRFPGLKCAR